MYKFFGYVHEVDSHNKSRKSDLALEKLWFTQFGWIWLCMIVSIKMTITNFLNIFCDTVKREHYNKLVGIRELLEQLALDYFNNPFSTDTGTPANNMLPVDEADEVEKGSTFRALPFSRCISPSAAARASSKITINSASSISCTLLTSITGSQNSPKRVETKEGGRYTRLTIG